MKKHNRVYTILLIVMAFWCLISIITMLTMSRSPAVKPESRPVFVRVALIQGAYVLAIVVTLTLRGTAPAAGRIATKALNIIMLFVIPLGTALGIYGLMKVDKEA